MVTACTIVARNRLAHARVLADSFLAHHSDGVISVLVIDDEARTLDHRGEPFRGLRLRDIGLDRVEIARLATISTMTPSSLKPSSQCCFDTC